MATDLVVLLFEQPIGRVSRSKGGRLSFTYEPEWRKALEAIPLSLSMPLAARTHRHVPIAAYLWGLLPDNEAIIQRWAVKFHVSPRNPFALISHVGQDCAGAAQFVLPERVEECLSSKKDSIEWLTEADVAERIRTLKADSSAWRIPRDTGQFSLAGAQPKTALLLQGKKWGVPAGRIPTTHILKPPTGDFDGFAENEHFCLALARTLGLPAASSTILNFDSEVVICIERYDRVRTDKDIVRVHQEDMCQAMGIEPTKKYENEGGPGAKDIVELIRTNSTSPNDDVDTFLKALAFNWLIAGTDAHAKNYSFLIGSRGRVRLAPLYDVASALPYDDLDFQKLKLAMKIGNDYRVRDIGVAEWRKFAAEIRFDFEQLQNAIVSFAERIPDESTSVCNNMREQGIEHPVIVRLHKNLCSRALNCLRLAN
jgi:serine/threonine-protein kinase HipA